MFACNEIAKSALRSHGSLTATANALRLAILHRLLLCRYCALAFLQTEVIEANILRE